MYIYIYIYIFIKRYTYNVITSYQLSLITDLLAQETFIMLPREIPQ